jgi:hypothetical protein
MNYWLTPTGQVFEGENVGFHTMFCNKYLQDNPKIDDDFHNWSENNPSRYTYQYFEQVLGWVRYCGWGKINKWITESEEYKRLPNGDIQIIQRRMTKRQKERIFELTGDLF